MTAPTRTRQRSHLSFSWRQTAFCLFLGVLTLPHSAQAQPPAEKGALCAQPGTWFSPRTQHAIDELKLIDDMAGRPIVLLGETHDNRDHHLWQLQVLSALHTRNPNIVIAFESFPRQSQPALDKWIQGLVDEETFLRESRWFDVWRFDPDLYLPLFHFARQNRIPMIAMNVERDLIRRIGRDGFDTVPEGEREGVSRPTPPPENYRRYLATVFGGHGSTDEKQGDVTATLNDPDFQRFVEAQTTWDRAMAERMAAVRRGGGEPLVVGIVGRGHLDYGSGIPHQLRGLGITNAAVLTPWDAGRPCNQLRNDDGVPVADAAFALMPSARGTEPDKPKLGVMIQTVEGNRGVHVDDIVPDSVAQDAGLQAGDVIIEAGGQAVADSRELITIIQAQSPGAWLPLRVRRDGATRDIVAKFPPPDDGPRNR